MTFFEQLIFDINFFPAKTDKKSLRRSFRRLKRPPLRRNEAPPPVVTQPVVDGTRQKPPEFLEDEIKVKQGTCQFKVTCCLNKKNTFWIGYNQLSILGEIFGSTRSKRQPRRCSLWGSRETSQTTKREKQNTSFTMHFARNHSTCKGNNL